MTNRGTMPISDWECKTKKLDKKWTTFWKVIRLRDAIGEVVSHMTSAIDKV